MALNDTSDSQVWPPERESQPYIYSNSKMAPLNIYSNEYAEKRKLIRQDYLKSLKHTPTQHDQSKRQKASRLIFEP